MRNIVAALIFFYLLMKKEQSYFLCKKLSNMWATKSQLLRLLPELFTPLPMDNSLGIKASKPIGRRKGQRERMSGYRSARVKCNTCFQLASI